MIRIRSTERFDKWLRNLKDRRAVTRIIERLHRAGEGNLGDVKSVGGGISEMRIPYGPGYRIYFLQEGNVLIILLCGGNKSTQQKDITEAKHLAKEWKE